MKAIRSILTFYQSFAILSLIITGSCVVILYAQGSGTLTVLFWFKMITMGVIFYHINKYKNDEFYYYKNLGLSKLTLWFSSFGSDITLFIFLLALTLRWR